MDLSPVILSMAQAEGPTSVLGQIVGTLLEQKSVALARVWFLDDDDCPVCRAKPSGSDGGALHLRASRGVSLEAGADWSRIDGRFHHIPLEGRLKVARIAVTGEPLLIPDLTRDQDWVADPEWVKRESLRGFIGHPLRFRGKVVGVLACFLRTEPDERTLEWLRVFAAHAAVAVGNCRAFQEIERLRARLEMERDYLLEETGHRSAFEEITGRSPALERLLRQVEMVAPTDANVLILGESGTGKELIARAIHQRSANAARPLVKVNCGSIPKELFESEFFGHVKGAFTGAIRDRVGRFQLADRGTLFLDEVAEIPLDLQAKLLRVLQEGEFERVGDDATRRVTVRILAATNRDLRAEVDAGRFRLDLFYRLSVFPLNVPALRDRREDIPLLTADFVRRACQRQHRAVPKIPQREIETLMGYDWPGNIRELQNVVERAVILTGRGPIQFHLSGGADAKSEERRGTETGAPRGYYTEEEWRRLERENLLAALRMADGKVAGPDGAAARLGLNANTLSSRLRALGIRKNYGS